MVHRAVGRPGVVLVGEGSPNRLASLLAAEKKRVARVAYEVPIIEFQVGNGEGQIPISKLQRKVMRLPRKLKPAAVSDINHRLKALQPSLQAPKGPDPEEHQAAQDAQAEGPLSRNYGKSAAYSRMTMVSEARSCRPRRSRSVSSGGITVSRIAVRTRAHRKPTRPPSVRIVLMPTSRFPTVNPGRRGEHVDLHREDGDGPELRVGQPVRDEHAEQPVDEQRQHPAGHAGHASRAVLGQAEPLARVSQACRWRRRAAAARLPSRPALAARAWPEPARDGPGRARGFLATTPRYPFRARELAAGHNRSPDLGRRPVTSVKHIRHGAEIAGG